MLKVIKMDLYRMFKSKYTYIVLAAAMLMMFASVFMTQQDISYYQQTRLQWKPCEKLAMK